MGISNSYPSGYVEQEFGVSGESLSVSEYQIFKSDIKMIIVFNEIPEGRVPCKDYQKITA